MVSVSCGPLPHSLYQKWLRPPVDEGCHHFSYAYRMEGKLTDLSAFVGRVAHVVGGGLLMLPLVNIVAFRLLQTFGFTLGQAFQRAVEKGDETVVKNYLESGFDPNMLCVDRRPLLYHANDLKVTRLLLEKGASCRNVCRDGTLWLEHLAKTDRMELVNQLADNGLDVSPYLTANVFKRAKGNSEWQTFLLHMGYLAIPEERQGLKCSCVTGLALETFIMKGEIGNLEDLLGWRSFEEIEGDLETISTVLPRLETQWIWTHIFEGALKKDGFKAELALKLLDKGAKMDALIMVFGEQPLIGLLENGHTDIARKLVEKGFVSIEPYFDDAFLAQPLSKKVCWFLIEMGCEKKVRPRIGSHAYIPGRDRNNPLEKVIFTCDQNALENLAKRMPRQDFLRNYRSLKNVCPRLNALWIWDVVADVYWREGQYNDFHYLVEEGLHHPSESFFESNKYGSDDVKRALIQLGYRGELRFGARFFGVFRADTFEERIYRRDEEGIRNYIVTHGFQKFYNALTALQGKYPKIYMGWVWNVLFQIPDTHYTQYQRIQRGQQLKDPPPGHIQIRELQSLFSKIDFSKVTKAQLTETLDGVEKVYTKRTLEPAVSKILNGIGRGHNVYSISPADKAKYTLQLQWIIHYLKQDLGNKPFLSEGKAAIFIGMLKECFVCHSRWNVVFDSTRKMLAGEEIVALFVEDQIQSALADYRSILVYRLLGRIPSTHTHDNLIHHLRGPRALPDEPVDRPYHGGMYGTLATAQAAFDPLYTPEGVLAAIFELTKSDNDFYNLLIDKLAMLGSQWQGNAPLRRAVQRYGEEARVTYKDLARLGIEVCCPTLTFEGAWEHLPTLNWGPLVTFPIDAFQDEDALKPFKAAAEKRFMDKWGAGKEGSAQQVYMQCVREVSPEQRGELLKDFGASRSYLATPTQVREFMEDRSKHIQCSDDCTFAQFYAAHPEIPQSLHRTAFLTRQLSAPVVKKHLISLALDLKYTFAPLPLRKYVEVKEEEVFREIAIPMKDEAPILRDHIHPLILAKLLVDMKLLDPEVRIFDGAFRA